MRCNVSHQGRQLRLLSLEICSRKRRKPTRRIQLYLTPPLFLCRNPLGLALHPFIPALLTKQKHQQQQLDLQIMQLEGQKQQFEQAAEHQARVDMQSFAQWRQTPDGRAFMQWATAADGVVQTIEDRNQQWLAAWNEWIKSEVSDAEVTAHRALTELPEQISAELSRSVLKFKLPTLKRYVWWIIGIAVVSAIVASVGTILIPVVLGALAYYVWATKRRNARLSELREDLIDAQETQRVRVTRLGFDPLDQPGVGRCGKGRGGRCRQVSGFSGPCSRQVGRFPNLVDVELKPLGLRVEVLVDPRRTAVLRPPVLERRGGGRR